MAFITDSREVPWLEIEAQKEKGSVPGHTAKPLGALGAVPVTLTATH